MIKTKNNVYITKEEALEIFEKGEKNGFVHQITKVKRSLKVTETYIKGKAEEEHCPHCRKKIELYYLSRDVPKVCYCFWCGGAIYRKRGLTKKNPMFDYSILTPEQVKEWGFEAYVNPEND